MSAKYTEAVWRDTSLKKNRLVIMLILADAANQTGVCTPMVSTLAIRARLSARQVQRYLRVLEEERYIAPFDGTNVGRGQARSYLLYPSIGVQKGDTFATKTNEKGDTFGPSWTDDVPDSVTRAPDLLPTTINTLPDTSSSTNLLKENIGDIGKEERVQREKENQDSPAWPKILRFYQRNIGKVTEAVEAELWRLYEIYPGLLYEAVNKAVLNNTRGSKPSMRFVEAICKGLQSDNERTQARREAMRVPEINQEVQEGLDLSYFNPALAAKLLKGNSNE